MALYCPKPNGVKPVCVERKRSHWAKENGNSFKKNKVAECANAKVKKDNYALSAVCENAGGCGLWTLMYHITCRQIAKASSDSSLTENTVKWAHECTSETDVCCQLMDREK